MSYPPDRSVSPTAATDVSNEKKRRASKACSCCRTRKIRCDVLERGLPCTKCRADGFECLVQARKKRRRKNETQVVPPSSERLSDSLIGQISSSRPVPQHVMLHQVPHYPFFRNFVPGGQQPLLPAHHRDQSVALPVSARDRAASQEGSPAQFVVDDDLQFLKLKGAFELPPRKTIDEFVSNYFQIFHPFFPVVDKYSFLEDYYRSDQEALLSRRGPSLLLLRAILFTASATISTNVLRDVGFSSRKQARSVFHRRTRYLYEFDYEADDITTIQALLLMSHYYPSMVEQKHTWFWVHQAIGLAQGAGLHHDAPQAPQRKLWARIWWACLVRDRLVTLGTGRPMHINSLDCNVPMLTPADLEEEGDSEDDRTVKLIFVEFVRLCQYMEGVLSLPKSVAAAANSLPQQIHLCETTLQHWKDNLPSAARHREEPGMNYQKRSVYTLHTAVLHLIYNTVIIALHQSHHVLDETRSNGPQLPPPKVQTAAQDSTRLALDLVKLDLVRFCPTICVTAILPPLIVHLLMMRANDSSGKQHGAGRFDECMSFLQQLSEIYWHASFYHEFFELAASNSQAKSAKTAARGARDPLVAFLNDRMPGKLGGKASEPHSQAASRKRTPVGPGFADQMSSARHRTNHGPKRNTPKGPVPLHNGSSEQPATTPPPEVILSDPPLLELLVASEDITPLDSGGQPFEDWLDDFGLFHHLFPSA